MLRGFAAFYIVASHIVVVRRLLGASPLIFFFHFGQEVVMLFFLISGFVIYYSTARHVDQTFLGYLGRRAGRIYPIFLVALLLPAALAWGRGEGAPGSIAQFIGNIFQLQDFGAGKPGVWFEPYGGNLPLWSLSYEWWFYMLFFPIYRYVAPRRQIHAAGALSAIGWLFYTLHPCQIALFLMYFFTWWCGAELARAYLEGTPLSFKGQARSFFYCGGLIAFLAANVAVYAAAGKALSLGIHPVLELRHFCACAVFLTFGLLWRRARWVGFERLFGWFIVVGPISYALYVFHYPLAVTATYFADIPSAALQVLAYVVVTVAAAWLAEGPFQRLINRIFHPSQHSPGKTG